MKKEIPQNQNTGIKQLGHKSWKASKVLKKENSLRSIFQDRTHVKLGLTKKEVISLFYNQDIRVVLNYSDEKIKSLWSQINDTRIRLRKERMIAIVPLLMPSGTMLDDSSLDNAISTKPRVLTIGTYVYHSCADMNTALAIRKTYDKIAEGIEKAGDDLEEITEEGIKQRQVVKVVNRQ